MTRELPRNSLSVADESAVVALAMGGDDFAYGELVRRRQSTIRNLLRRLCGDEALADDLSQITFVHAWRKLHTLKSAGAFGGWLRKPAVNVWLQHARSHGAGATATGSAFEPSHEPTVAEKLDLDHALALLPHDVRLCIVLAYAEHMSHREICESTGFPLGMVKSHIARGGARMRQALNAYR